MPGEVVHTTEHLATLRLRHCNIAVILDEPSQTDTRDSGIQQRTCEMLTKDLWNKGEVSTF